MSVAASVQEMLPNLPGYRVLPTAAKSAKKTQLFQHIDGMIFPKELPAPAPYHDGSDESVHTHDVMSLGPGGTTSMTSRPHSRPHIQSQLYTVKSAAIVLSFIASFTSISPNGSLDDGKKVRKANIYYYEEDGTMSVVERPQLNSGVPQGTLVKRAVVWKKNGAPVTPLDFKIGEDLEIFGIKYRLLDCDASTRRYLDRRSGSPGRGSVGGDSGVFDDLASFGDASGPPPGAEWGNLDATGAEGNGGFGSSGPQTAGPSDGNEWGKFRSKKNSNKIFMEAKLGNTVNNKGREGFIRYGNKTLKFRCVWDNTNKLYGDMMEYSLVYYLADDTIEIFSVATANSGSKDQFSRLLQRSKLPKAFAFQQIGDHYDTASSAFYTWKDLVIGMELNVYARQLRIIDADSLTRTFYSNYHYPLATRVDLEKPPAVEHQREIPPSTGFGSEEDSLRSCSGPLLPGPPRIKKLGENKVLTFRALLLSGGPDDARRRFVLSYYLQDQTIKIEEIPVRNSGFVGGVFLSRRPIKSDDGTLLTEHGLYVGAPVTVFKHVFRLLETNDGTLKWMEEKGLPWSSPSLVFYKARSFDRLVADAASGRLADEFRARLGPSATLVSPEVVSDVLAAYDAVGDDGVQLSLHEVITMVRFTSASGKAAETDYRQLIQQIVDPALPSDD